MTLLLMLLASFPVRVAVLGDRTGSPDEREYEIAITAIELMSPDIVLSVGDFVEGNGDPQEADLDWDRILPLLDRLTGRFPFIFTPGNNDIWDSITRDMWMERTGAEPSGIQEVEGITFVVWDSSLPYRLEPEHLAEIDSLTEDLDAGTPWVFVTHKPFWFMSYQDSAAVAEFRGMMEEKGALAVVGGHIHLFAAQRTGGVLYVSAGPSGSSVPEPDPYMGDMTQVGWMTLWPDSVEYTVLDARGVYPETINTGQELDLSYRYRMELLDPGLLEPGLESAILTVRPVEEVPRDFHIVVEPGTWGMDPEEVSLQDLAEPADIVFTLDPTESPYPVPVISVTTSYGDRDRELHFSEPWPVMMRTNAFLSDPVLDGRGTDEEYRPAFNDHFADDEGQPSDILYSRFRTSNDGELLFLSVEMEKVAGIEEDYAGVLLAGAEGSFLWFKVHPDGTVDASTVSPDWDVSPMEDGYDSAVIEDDAGWYFELAVRIDLLEIIDDHARLNVYRSSDDLFESWSYPASFDTSTMGLVWIQPEM